MIPLLILGGVLAAVLSPMLFRANTSHTLAAYTPGDSWSRRYYPGLSDYQHDVNDAWFEQMLALLKPDGILGIPNLQKFFNKRGEEVPRSGENGGSPGRYEAARFTPGQPQFSLGQVVMTPGVQVLIEEALDHQMMIGMLRRHQEGDWGDLGSEDKAANDEAVEQGDRIFSMYNFKGTKVYVITEWDRSVTTILLPGDY